jgi:tRNA dimethylallyltransferase
MKSTPCNLIVILGPTASGKTRLAAQLAYDLRSEVLSADSRQVYRGMDLGTGKDLDEFIVDGIAVPYHLIDIVSPDYEFNVFEYQCRFCDWFTLLRGRGVIPVMVGGTGLYIEAAVQGYRMVEVPEDPQFREELEGVDTESLRRRLNAAAPRQHNTTDLADRHRLIRAIEIAEYTRDHGSLEARDVPRVAPVIIGVRWDRTILRRRIAERLHRRLDAGMVDEVKRLHDGGTSWEKLSFFGLEYRYVSLYLRGSLTYDEMVTTLVTKIGQFAKRQETWFRRMERRGTAIHWIEGDDYEQVRAIVASKVYAHDA